MVNGYVKNRLSHDMTDEESNSVSNFLYQITMAQGSTETAIMVLFSPAL